MLLIGSRAAQYWDSDFRRAKDWDFIASFKEAMMLVSKLEKDKKIKEVKQFETKISIKTICYPPIEIEISNFSNSSSFLFSQKDRFELQDTPFGPAFVVPKEYLFLIKKSHLYWDINWLQNIEDYHYIKNNWSFKLEANHQDYFKIRLNEHAKKYGQKIIDLNQLNDDIFYQSENYVNKTIPPSYLHELIKYGKVPLYAQVKTHYDKSKSEKEKWDKLSFEDKMSVVKEEAMVVALERYLLNVDNKLSELEAYHKALNKICTDLTSGWFREFAIENWMSVKKLDKNLNSIVLQVRQSKYIKQKK